MTIGFTQRTDVLNIEALYKEHLVKLRLSAELQNLEPPTGVQQKAPLTGAGGGSPGYRNHEMKTTISATVILSALCILSLFCGCTSSQPGRGVNMTFNEWAAKQARTNSVFGQACRGDADAIRYFFQTADSLVHQKDVDAEGLTTSRDQLWYILRSAGDPVFAQVLAVSPPTTRSAVKEQLVYQENEIRQNYPETASELGL